MDGVFITIPIIVATKTRFKAGDRVVWTKDGITGPEGIVLRAKKDEVIVEWDSLPNSDAEWAEDFFDWNELIEENEAATNPAFLQPANQTALGFDHTASVMKTAIPLPELVRQTNAFSKKYRPGCTPTMLDSNPKALFLHYNVKCNKEDSDPAGHDVRVQFDVTKVQESQKAKDLDIQVSCSCPAFLYWGAQWNLHQRDGLLGTPRPKLVAPTERLDLRGNFVICKHIHAVFERVLPSVQHNIVKILREREVRRNKQKMKDTPGKLQEKQEEMKRKKEMDKIRKIKDKEVRDKMLESLKNEEQARLLHEQQLDNQGKAPGEVVEREAPALTPEEEAVTTKAVPAWMELPEHYKAKPDSEDEDVSAIEDLMQQEESKIEEAHKEGLPHLHRGLPYDIEPEEEDDDTVMRKFESLVLDRKVGTRVQVPGIGTLEEGMRVLAFAGARMIHGEITKIKKNKERPEFSMVYIREDGQNWVGIHRADLVRLPQGGLF